jgi:polyhydroxyalkanoate synthesis regulator phasin
MKPKTLIELLTLSSNIYLIAKDEKLMKKVGELVEKGKSKINDLTEEFTDGDDEETLMQKLIQKAHQAKEELDQKMEEVAIKVYDKMKIAHINEVKKLEVQIDQLKKECASAEARIVSLETAEN